MAYQNGDNNGSTQSAQENTRNGVEDLQRLRSSENCNGCDGIKGSIAQNGDSDANPNARRAITAPNRSSCTRESVGDGLNRIDQRMASMNADCDQSIARPFGRGAAFFSSRSAVPRGVPPISVAEARSRNFLLGCATSWGSILGVGQLNANLADRKLKLLVTTWNMNCVPGSSTNVTCLQDILLPAEVHLVPEMYAIGIQEFQTNREEWEVTLQETVGFSHVLLHSVVVGTLYAAVFIRRELIWFCSEAEDASLITRPLVKTKGGLGISLQLFGTTFLFVNSHFKAHDDQLKERIEDFEKCRLGIDLPKNLPAKEKPRPNDVTKRFDCVFWFGDLNFRVGLKREQVLRVVNEQRRNGSREYGELLIHDQLRNTMSEGAIFHGFQEADIRFEPTYKFDTGTNTYDTSFKQRTPGYTDRILFRAKRKGTIECLVYNAVHTVTVSDHKPVYGLFEVLVSPGKDNIPLAAGMFARDIYKEAVARRAAMVDPLLGNKASRLCSLQ